jgi:hypothetical protein
MHNGAMDSTEHIRSPLFALFGALVFSIVIAPAQASLFFVRGAREWRNPLMVWLTARWSLWSVSG